MKIAGQSVAHPAGIADILLLERPEVFTLVDDLVFPHNGGTALPDHLAVRLESERWPVAPAFRRQCR